MNLPKQLFSVSFASTKRTSIYSCTSLEQPLCTLSLPHAFDKVILNGTSNLIASFSSKTLHLTDARTSEPIASVQFPTKIRAVFMQHDRIYVLFDWNLLAYTLVSNSRVCYIYIIFISFSFHLIERIGILTLILLCLYVGNNPSPPPRKPLHKPTWHRHSLFRPPRPPFSPARSSMIPLSLTRAQILVCNLIKRS